MSNQNEPPKPPQAVDLSPRIAVIGVGGAGGNAVNNMIAAGLEGVTFIVANTDAQALAMSKAQHQIQLGVALTQGQGAGSKPEIGAAAAEEAVEEIRNQIDGCHMVFVAAGMGGGTGTGAAAIVARVAHELNILTVGVVTKPFHFEGNRRMRAAEVGIAELARQVDTLIAIPNQNLFRIANEKTTFAEAFELADKVLHAGISCVTDLIVREGLINLDFADVRAIMLDMGAAMMGTGEASGDKRAVEAAELAIANPLLDDVTLKGARGLLVSISGSEDLTLFEVDAAANRIREEVDPEANIIVGANFDPDLKDRIRVSIVASGLRDTASQTLSHAAQPPRMAGVSQNTDRQYAHVAQVRGQAHARQRPPVQPPQKSQDISPLPPRTVATPAPQRPTVAAQRQTAVQTGGGVQIEVGPPRMLTAGALSRPVPQDGPAMLQETAKAAFMPQAPAALRRTPPRMPEIEDFPPIAQRELRKIDTEKAPATAARKRSRLFDRLKGGLEGTGASQVTDLADIATAIDSADASQASEAQDAEIPGFFKRKIHR